MMLFKVTPVPIPNTKVKLLEADGTARAAVWESRWLPGLYKIKSTCSNTSTFLLYRNLIYQIEDILEFKVNNLNK